MERTERERVGAEGRRTALVTGGTSGIGRVAAEALVRAGMRVCIVGRSEARCREAVDALSVADADGPAVDYRVADLSLRGEVERLADELLARDRPLHLLLNNAGAVFGVPRRVTADGIEQTFALNHLAYFQLTLRLLDRLRSSQPARIVNVASDAYAYARGGFDFDDFNAERSYWPHRQYGRSKLANLLFTRSLRARLEGSGVEVAAWSPAGLTATRFAYGAHPIAKHVMRLMHPFSLHPDEATASLVDLCLAPTGAIETGAFFCGDAQTPVDPSLCHDEAATRLWTLSEQLTGVST